MVRYLVSECGERSGSVGRVLDLGCKRWSKIFNYSTHPAGRVTLQFSLVLRTYVLVL